MDQTGPKQVLNNSLKTSDKTVNPSGLVKSDWSNLSVSNFSTTTWSENSFNKNAALCLLGTHLVDKTENFSFETSHLVLTWLLAITFFLLFPDFELFWLFFCSWSCDSGGGGGFLCKNDMKSIKTWWPLYGSSKNSRNQLKQRTYRYKHSTDLVFQNFSPLLQAKGGTQLHNVAAQREFELNTN